MQRYANLKVLNYNIPWFAGQSADTGTSPFATRFSSTMLQCEVAAWLEAQVAQTFQISNDKHAMIETRTALRSRE